jgi:phosphatidylglycerophosphate synthase
MAKHARRQTGNHWFFHSWWGRFITALVFIGVAYGLISLAIDSGSLWQYVAGLFLAYWAIVHFVRGLRQAFSR